jgi:hypothetical protein
MNNVLSFPAVAALTILQLLSSRLARSSGTEHRKEQFCGALNGSTVPRRLSSARATTSGSGIVSASTRPFNGIRTGVARASH